MRRSGYPVDQRRLLAVSGGQVERVQPVPKVPDASAPTSASMWPVRVAEGSNTMRATWAAVAG